MSYTRPIASAADATWQGAAAYTRPPASAADAAWAAAVPQARIAVGTPLGAVRTLVQTVTAARIAVRTPLGAASILAEFGSATVSVRISVSSPLGAVQVLAQTVTAARIAVRTPLGAPQVLAVAREVVSARIAVGTPLGRVSVWGASLVRAYASAPSPLGNVLALAFVPIGAQIAVSSPLGSGQALAYHDFTAGLGDVVTRFVMELITPSGTVRVPISSWQATLQTGSSNYVQCVIPACTMWVDAINTATEFVIYRRAVLPNGTAIEYEMARAPAASAQFDQGPERHSCTLSGYSDAFAASENPPAIYDRALSGIRSISSGSSYRVRCAVDWLLRPGHRAFVQGAPFVVAFINYYAPSEFDCYMDVGG